MTGASVVQICVKEARLLILVCTNVEVVGMFRSVYWMVGLKEDVKDNIRKNSLVIIQVVACYGFCVDVESLISVKVGPFSWRCLICIISFIGPKEWPSLTFWPRNNCF